MNPDAAFVVVSKPEFLHEGAEIEDFKSRERVVVGADNDRAKARSLRHPAGARRGLATHRQPI